MVTMVHDATGRSHTVPKTKFNKACIALDPSKLMFLLIPQRAGCKCSRVCYTLPLTADQVLSERTPMWTSAESARTLYAKRLRSTNAGLVGRDGTIHTGAVLKY